MKAVIMAGGEGTRLRPLTCGKPKPMVPMANKPVMEHIIELLKRHNILSVAATLQYMPDIISDYFGDGGPYGIKLRYYIEQKPLGTAGSVKNAEGFLDGTFLVISGDALTDIDLKRAVDFHMERDAIATIVLKRVDVPIEYGVVVTGPDGSIIRFIEKPGWGEVFSDTVNTGIYVLSPEIFKYIKPNEAFDFSKDLFPILLDEKRRIFGYIAEEYWCDIGDIKAYIQAHADILNGKVNVNIPGSRYRNGIWIGEGTIIDESASLNAPCITGSHCHIGSGAYIGGYSVIGDNALISERCRIKRSIIWRNCTISEDVKLSAGIVCDNAYLKRGVSLFEQSVIGDRSLVGERAIIRPSVKIWPDKFIGECAEVSANLVWGSKVGRRIFGNRGVCGETNTDITPEFAAKLGASFGSLTGGGGNIGVSCDGSSAAFMIKSALISGLLSSGIGVSDFKRLILPAFRSAVRFYRLDGGIYASSSADSKFILSIDFLNKTGGNIDRGTERKVENAFVRDDFNRCKGDCLAGVTEVAGFDQFYLKNILHDVKSRSLRYKILLKAGPAFISNAVTQLLGELGCKVELADVDESDDKREAGVAYFRSAVLCGGFDLGVSIENSCEKMLMVDDKGRLVTEDLFIALISLVLFRKVQGSTVFVPLSASRAVEKLADLYHGSVIRTKTSPKDVMEKIFGKDAKENLLEQFTMHFDSIAGLVKLLDYMSINQLRLSDLVDMIPEIHIRRRQVECGWSSKGRVIRKLIQENGGSGVETLEGVKIYNDKGWVLVLPDAEKPICSVIGEGVNAEFAEELTDIYVKKVREISRS